MTEQERQEAKLRARSHIHAIEDSEFFKQIQDERDRAYWEYAIARSDYDRLIGETDENFKIACNNIHFEVREVLWRLERLADFLKGKCVAIREGLGPRPYADEEDSDQ